MPGKYQHADAPKPPENATNALVERTVASFNANGQSIPKQELAPVPETHPGGYYKNAQGIVVNANGEPILLSADAQIPDQDSATLEEIVRELGADNPLARRLIAQRTARERRAKKLAAQEKSAPELPDDQKAAEAFKKQQDAKKSAGAS